MKKARIAANVILVSIFAVGFIQTAIIVKGDISEMQENIESGSTIETAATMATVIREELLDREIGLEVPAGNTAFKSYMDFRAITNHRSAQWKLQEEASTDEHGLRVYDGYYVVALGSYYATSIGDKFEITLDNGTSFKAIVGDFKADVHTDYFNQYYPMANGKKNIVEFIVDVNELDGYARKMGDISVIDGFDGNVTKIVRCYDE